MLWADMVNVRKKNCYDGDHELWQVEGTAISRSDDANDNSDAKWYCVLGDGGVNLKEGATSKSCVNLNLLRANDDFERLSCEDSNRKQIMNVEWNVSHYDFLENIWFNLEKRWYRQEWNYGVWGGEIFWKPVRRRCRQQWHDVRWFFWEPVGRRCRQQCQRLWGDCALTIPLRLASTLSHSQSCPGQPSNKTKHAKETKKAKLFCENSSVHFAGPAMQAWG